MIRRVKCFTKQNSTGCNNERSDCDVAGAEDPKGACVNEKSSHRAWYRADCLCGGLHTAYIADSRFLFVVLAFFAALVYYGVYDIVRTYNRED